MKDKFFVGRVSGEVKYMGELHEGATTLTIGTGEYFSAINAAKDANAATPTAPDAVAAPTLAESLPTNVFFIQVELFHQLLVFNFRILRFFRAVFGGVIASEASILQHRYLKNANYSH